MEQIIDDFNNYEVKKAYIDMIEDAYRLFPNLKPTLKVFQDSTTGVETFNQYLKIINQTPSVITSNHLILK